MALELLDERGFVFLDEERRPYRVKMWEGEPWLFYWLDSQKKWVSLRHVTQSEVWSFPDNLTDEQQALYMEQKGAE